MCGCAFALAVQALGWAGRALITGATEAAWPQNGPDSRASGCNGKYCSAWARPCMGTMPPFP
eukprot:CAMPEP_0171249768 /NCGR_PEP_ID=MMETSP0790-20130122/49722_1 /TAXON_ID=2925 /ORGANISM="Alexandrium catenella, Strain OF101" /LENGTH=61 /DNA_ID=CAMNT_0011717301 /DNA_START=38 /DNA_END=220 /DNA_ORIENTATION=-